jgi:hypothetical protein
MTVDEEKQPSDHRVQVLSESLPHHDYCARLNKAIQQIQYFQSWEMALTVDLADKKSVAAECFRCYAEKLPVPSASKRDVLEYEQFTFWQLACSLH